MATKKDRPSVKNDEQYEALRDKGYSKERSARISNASSSKGGKNESGGRKSGSSSRSSSGRGTSGSRTRGGGGGLGDRSKEELYEMAKQKDIKGRSRMNKDQLVRALNKQEGGRGQSKSSSGKR